MLLNKNVLHIYFNFSEFKSTIWKIRMKRLLENNNFKMEKKKYERQKLA